MIANSFDSVDANADGSIDKDELTASLKKMMPSGGRGAGGPGGRSGGPAGAAGSESRTGPGGTGSR